MSYIFESPIQHSKTILKLLKEFAEYFQELEKVTATEEEMKETLFCKNPKSKALLIKESENSEIIGFALYSYQLSGYSFKENIIYINVLHISKKYRNSGFGKKVMHFFYKKAIDENCFRIEWNCYGPNENAIKFYDNLGAKKVLDNIQYRLNKDDMEKILNSQ